MISQGEFWARVAKGDGCWLWTGRVNRDGYGTIKNTRGARPVMIMAHRFAWEAARGQIPAGLFVLHHCDNPPCVRPDHLYTGTDVDNSRDKVSRGRQSRLLGEANCAARLTETLVREIFAARGRIGQSELGRRYGVDRKAISHIFTGYNWSHVTGLPQRPRSGRTLRAGQPSTKETP